MQQVLYNLVDNAHYALSSEGGGSIELATWTDGDRIYLRVADDGPGIPENLLNRIFEPFVTTKPRGEGAGLGLSMCRRNIEVHQGDIAGYNRPGGGASFEAMLPVGGAARAKVVEEERERPLEEPMSSNGSMRVLFIDDEPALCALVKEYLSRKGYDVTVAETGERGLELAIADDFDVIICDMRLPGISGEDVCMALLDEKPSAAERIMIATGDILSPQTQSFFNRTGLPHIHKPFGLGQLEEIIARFAEPSAVRGS